MQIDLAMLGSPEGSEPAQRSSDRQFAVGDRVIVINSNSYDSSALWGPLGITHPMAGYYGRVTGMDDLFVVVALIGSTTGDTQHLISEGGSPFNWYFYPKELDHAD